MRTALIGSTGFIGGNLARQFPFDECYHSKNISSIRGQEFGLVVCGGVSAVKWQANRNPEEEPARIDSLLGGLETVGGSRGVVVSPGGGLPRAPHAEENSGYHSPPNPP